MRRYQEIWIKIKETCDPDEWVTVTCTYPGQIQTVINMVQAEKSHEHTAKRATGQAGYGRLEIKRDFAKLQVSFKLRNAGAQL